MEIEVYLDKECDVNPNEKIDTGNDSYWKLKDLVAAYIEEEELVKKSDSLQLVSSCYAVFDEEDNIVQLYQTEDKANKGMEEFKRSHEHTDFYVDTMQIN